MFYTQILARMSGREKARRASDKGKQESRYTATLGIDVKGLGESDGFDSGSPIQHVITADLSGEAVPLDLEDMGGAGLVAAGCAQGAKDE